MRTPFSTDSEDNEPEGDNGVGDNGYVFHNWGGPGGSNEPEEQEPQEL